MKLEVRPGKTLEIVRGDITEARVDAIVNAANQHLVGGGGVDGAIHRAGGRAIADECRRIGGCATGEAVATSAGNLEAKHVIHAVAPRWRGGQRGEAELLKSAYESAMRLAAGLGAQSVAFPSLGTGIYGNPIAESARVALDAVRTELQGETAVERVTFFLFSEHDLRVYEEALRELAARTDKAATARE